jgi:hypothetical protein
MSGSLVINGGVSSIKNNILDFDAGQSLYLSATNVVLDGTVINVKAPITVGILKKNINGLSTKIYDDTSAPSISESDINLGVIVYGQNGQDGLYYDGQYGLPYVQSQNSYMVDSSIGYNTGSVPPNLLNEVNNPANALGNVLEVLLPASLPTFSVGDSVEFTIVNNGNNSLRLTDQTNYKVVGFDVVYDANSAKFIAYKVSESLYYVIRSA